MALAGNGHTKRCTRARFRRSGRKRAITVMRSRFTSSVTCLVMRLVPMMRIRIVSASIFFRDQILYSQGVVTSRRNPPPGGLCPW